MASCKVNNLEQNGASEKVTPFENMVNLWLSAAKYIEVHNNDSGVEVMNNESDEDKKRNVLVNILSDNNPKETSEKTEKEDIKKITADVPVKKPAEASTSKNGRNEKNTKKEIKEEPTAVTPMVPINTSKKGRKEKNKKKEIKKESSVIPMKCLGKRTFIKRSIYKEINWTSYTKATRQLLAALFPRTVLATHSLSGKQSPAFQDKPAKKILDINIIGDIIKTVCRKSDVKENLVRHVITIKCADEAKMLRQRQNKRTV